MSRATLASLVGLHETTIKRYEDGNIKNVNLDKINEISKILDLNLDKVLLIGSWEEKYNNDGHLANEAKAFDLISKVFGSAAVELVNDYNQLNEIGQSKASEYVADLVEQEKYRKSN